MNNKYILVSYDDEGLIVHGIQNTVSLESAILLFELYPFTYPDDFQTNVEEIDSMERIGLTPPEPQYHTKEEAFEDVVAYYRDPDNSGNRMDGDSSSGYVIIEIKPDDTYTYYGARRGY